MKMWTPSNKIIDLLESKYEKYNDFSFIALDPISIPHKFTLKQDIEIAALFAAILAWGQRKTIIQKCTDLMERMDNAPFQFITQTQDSDLKILEGFKHRTFNDFDLLFFVDFLKNHYSKNESLESAFLKKNNENQNVKENLIEFKKYFFDYSTEKIRTSKHIPTPLNQSACKRLNMFLRWMVRKDTKGVDFGIWQNLKTSQLVVPCDIHVETSSKYLNLTKRTKADWTMAEEITEQLKKLDPNDPTKYDFALFGMGIENYFKNIAPKNHL